MDSKTIANGILRALAIIFGVLLLLYFLYKIQSVIIYIAIAAVVTLIARPIIRFLKKYLKFGNTLAVVTTMFLFLLLLFGLGGMFIPLIIKQGENLSLLNSQEFKSNLERIYNQFNEYLLSRNINLFDEIKHLDLSAGFKQIPNLLNSVVATFGSFTIGLFSVLFISFFLMKDKYILNKALITIVPNESEKRFTKSFEKIKDLLSRYFIGLVFQILIIFIIYTVTLLILGVESAIVIAFLAALLNLIPYIGPMIGALLIMFLTMTDNLGQDFQTQILPTMLWAMFGYLIAQLVDNFFSQPFIFSKSVKSHPLEIFLIIIIGGLLFGISGMVLAVPTYTAIKVILKEFLSENKIVKSLTKSL
jgi:predicted PurR-regulated permease PerM